MKPYNKRIHCIIAFVLFGVLVPMVHCFDPLDGPYFDSFPDVYNFNERGVGVTDSWTLKLQNLNTPGHWNLYIKDIQVVEGNHQVFSIAAQPETPFVLKDGDKDAREIVVHFKAKQDIRYQAYLDITWNTKRHEGWEFHYKQDQTIRILLRNRYTKREEYD
ncbi:MAG: hypothetical protein EP343_12080 [Deltaproteobacteria bacterium]|nr:MAG: hypothetical protein EP343_12080 [Deltaproteobacteria bacterium]